MSYLSLNANKDVIQEFSFRRGQFAASLMLNTKYITNLGSRLAGVGVMGGIGLNGDRSEEYLQLVDF